MALSKYNHKAVETEAAFYADFFRLIVMFLCMLGPGSGTIERYGLDGVDVPGWALTLIPST